MKNKKRRIAPSILSADFSRLGEEVEAIAKAGADWIHVDVMDGHFVPNITIGPAVVASLRKTTALPFDVHLMIENASLYIDAFAKAGADWISVHQEACLHLDRVLGKIRDAGVHPGVVLNPATPLSAIQSVLSQVEYVLVMSVNPGFAGQAFIASTFDKIRALAALRKEQKLNFLIEVDGGVKLDNIEELATAGADIFVAGSAIFGTDNYATTIREMKRRIAIQ